MSKHRYDYYFCLNRKDGKCDIPVADVEHAIINLLKDLKFSDSDRQELAMQISKELASEQHYAEIEVKQQTQRLNRSLAEQESLLQAYYEINIRHLTEAKSLLHCCNGARRRSRKQNSPSLARIAGVILWL